MKKPKQPHLMSPQQACNKLPIWKLLALWIVILNDGHARSLAGFGQQKEKTGLHNYSGFSLVISFSPLLLLSIVVFSWRSAHHMSGAQ